MTEATATCRRELDLEIPADEVSKKMESVAKEFARVARVPGFRPGKAPVSLIRRRFAEDGAVAVAESDLLIAVGVRFDDVFFVRRQFAVIVKSDQVRDRIASHVNSPKTARIFWVARNRQFFAASSVVPRISPMLRRRSPW